MCMPAKRPKIPFFEPQGSPRGELRSVFHVRQLYSPHSNVISKKNCNREKFFFPSEVPQGGALLTEFNMGTQQLEAITPIDMH